LDIFNKSSAAAKTGDRLDTADMDRKVGGALPLFAVIGAGSSSNTMSPGPRPTCIQSGI